MQDTDLDSTQGDSNASSEPPINTIEEILENLLGEFHEHKCLTCNGTNGGCINCRKTGYNQTPCKICDKDGIAFKNRTEATQAINHLITQARKDELEKLVLDVGLFPDDIANYGGELLGKWSERKLTHSKIEDRIKEVKNSE